MLGVIASLLWWSRLEEARAELFLNPVWDPVPYFDAAVVTGGPVQNTESSRVYVHETAGSPDDGLWTINDDGTYTNYDFGAHHTANRLLWDGLDGVYAPFLASDWQVRGVRRSGTANWQRNFSGNYGGLRAIRTTDGNLVLIMGEQLTANYFGMKLNRANGQCLWGGVPNCWATWHMTSVWPNAQGGVQKIVTDGLNGFIMFRWRTVAPNFYEFEVRRIDGAGSSVWTRAHYAATKEFDRIESVIQQDGSIYYLGTAVCNWCGPKNWKLDRIAVSNGTLQWANPLTIAPRDANTQALAVESGDAELTVAWQRADKSILMNRIDLAIPAKKWANDLVVFPPVNLDHWSYWKLFAGSQGIAYVAYCDTSDVCKIQGVNAQGEAILALGGIRLHDSSVPVFGYHQRTVDGATEDCIDQSYVSGDGYVRAQMFCFSNGPELTRPVCSLDNGGSFTLCPDAQIGATLSHVQTSCTPGTTLPFGDRPLAGEIGVNEGRPQIDGQYVGYEQGSELYYYDLGPDLVFGSGDDGTAVRATNDEVRDVLLDVDEGRMLGARGDSGDQLRIYNIANGSFDPGTLNLVDWTAAVDGRRLVYRWQMGGGANLYLRDLGPDGRLGTGDDGANEDLGFDAPQDLSISGRYVVMKPWSQNKIQIFDLEARTLQTVADPGAGVDSPSISGRHIAWIDFRNDPNSSDVYLYDLGPDLLFNTGDDISAQRISTSPKDEYRSNVKNNIITWTRLMNEGATGWDIDYDVYKYDLGPDSQYGTADDGGEVAVTQVPHSQTGADSNGTSIVWSDNRNDPASGDVYITPYAGGNAAEIDGVTFSLTSPSGDVYTDEPATIVNGDAHTLNYPVVIDEPGQWRLSATCLDRLNNTATDEVLWDVNPWPFSDSQKLSVYDGVTQISRSSGDTLEIGNAGRDLASTGSIYLRPNQSYAGLAWEGIPGVASQRLHLPLGIDGQPAVLAQGSGTLDSPNGANAVAGFFDGAGKDAGGAGVGGSVLSCGSAGGCAAGRFDGGSEVGLHAESLDASFPAIRAENASDGTSASNTSGRFEGKVNVTGNLEAVPVSFPSCAWIEVVQGETVCPNNGFVAGFDKRDNSQLDLIYCCGN